MKANSVKGPVSPKSIEFYEILKSCVKNLEDDNIKIRQSVYSEVFKIEKYIKKKDGCFFHKGTSLFLHGVIDKVKEIVNDLLVKYYTEVVFSDASSESSGDDISLSDDRGLSEDSPEWMKDIIDFDDPILKNRSVIFSRRKIQYNDHPKFPVYYIFVLGESDLDETEFDENDDLIGESINVWHCLEKKLLPYFENNEKKLFNEIIFGISSKKFFIDQTVSRNGDSYCQNGTEYDMNKNDFYTKDTELLDTIFLAIKKYNKEQFGMDTSDSEEDRGLSEDSPDWMKAITESEFLDDSPLLKDLQIIVSRRKISYFDCVAEYVVFVTGNDPVLDSTVFDKDCNSIGKREDISQFIGKYLLKFFDSEEEMEDNVGFLITSVKKLKNSFKLRLDNNNTYGHFQYSPVKSDFYSSDKELVDELFSDTLDNEIFSDT